MNGQTLNARVGTALHPQSTNVAGGMTYRPPGSPVGVEQRPARLSHKQEVVGSTPTPATKDVPPLGICPAITKKGDECRGYPTLTGFCTGHSNQVGHALKELLGG